MQKLPAIILIVLIKFSAMPYIASASVYRNRVPINIRVERSALQRDQLLSYEEDSDKYANQLKLQESLAFNISPADAYPPKKTDPQSVPKKQQNPSPAKQSHHLRNFIIIFAIGAGLLIALAAAAK